MNQEHKFNMPLGSCYAYTGDKKEVLIYWNGLKKAHDSNNNELLTVGTNFDLSTIPGHKMPDRLMIVYDFMHRVMLYPLQDNGVIKFLNKEKFNDFIESRLTF